MKDIFDPNDTDENQFNDDSNDYHDDNTIGFDDLDIPVHTESDFDLSDTEFDKINQHAENDPLEHHRHDDITFGSSCVTACSNTCIGGCSGSCSGTCSGNCYGSCNGYCSGT